MFIKRIQIPKEIVLIYMIISGLEITLYIFFKEKNT